MMSTASRDRPEAIMNNCLNCGADLLCIGGECYGHCHECGHRHASIDHVACKEWPEDAPYKTVGLGHCKKCGSRVCWAQYLAWEKAFGIMLNAREHASEPITKEQFFAEWDG